ncbi:MAG: succinate dehydrogenase [Sandaracinaceae bacterium]
MATRLPVLGGHVEGFGATHRKDPWWQSPLVVFLGLSAFVAYANWALFQANHYYAEPYLSPFYSPVLFSATNMPGAAPLSESWFGEWPSWWPRFLPPSPAMLILIFPLSFRFTCYYYRKAYYRAFAGSPPGCAVGPLGQGRRRYEGETSLMIFQNLHRYALYGAIVFIFLLGHDAYKAFFKNGEFGFGVGTLVITLNVVFIASYTFGCHSFRHLIGGHDNCMSCGQNTVKYGAWKRATWFNERHQLFAWMSLIWVGFTDAYVRLVSMGVIEDINTWSSGMGNS